MSHQIPLGLSDFKKLRENGANVVDKSLFIKEIRNYQPSHGSLVTPPPSSFWQNLKSLHAPLFF
ncbi:hypothetical protein PN36_13055 [Candidatus Thiomargarita nelsonii]|uniref:Uncharacterized protein n=1 Tax=Candidatus Thiomargarita nelsonii TaxID=1003181 RepID=A0A4E0RIP4_9GAMM|nr:hypothetical protein PN36_13055 [Candidatus Thiomargarita nelsonii]